MRRDSEGVLTPASPLVPWSAAWTPAEVIAVLEPLVLEARRARLTEVIGARLGSVTLLMDAPHDPHNGAAILRSADAFGVQTVHVVPREEQFLVSGSVAKGTERWVDVVHHTSPEAAVAELAREGFTLVATHPKGALSPGELADVPRLCLVLGNEHDGIRHALTEAATHSVQIPMRGFVESLNVSVSAAILLAAATNRRAGDLDDEQKRLLYARGLFATVHRADEILAAKEPRPAAGA
jgi:tRNA (guanosine-2'-O-)-methyltransferase